MLGPSFEQTWILITQGGIVPIKFGWKWHGGSGGDSKIYGQCIFAIS